MSPQFTVGLRSRLFGFWIGVGQTLEQQLVTDKLDHGGLGSLFGLKRALLGALSDRKKPLTTHVIYPFRAIRNRTIFTKSF